MMNVLLSHDCNSSSFITLQGFEKLGGMAYFHFLPTKQFSILARPSQTNLAFDVAFEIEYNETEIRREIKSGRLVKLLKTVADVENGIGRISFIYVDGFYLPMGIADIPEDALIEFAGKQNLSDIL